MRTYAALQRIMLHFCYYLQSSGMTLLAWEKPLIVLPVGKEHRPQFRAPCGEDNL